ncbi:MAG TPA: VOC family protein [Rhizomicrobium sp.]|jgi:hypothetical protein
MAIQLGYFTIGVTDVPRAVAFYGALFGWEFEDGANDSYAHVSNATPPMGLNKAKPADLSAFYFRVEDVAAMAAKVKALGGVPGEIKEYPSGRNSLCQDDQGTTFSLWQPSAGY